jgi:hypothetical protein
MSIEVGFSPDSKYVIAGSENKKVIFWNIDTKKEM